MNRPHAARALAILTGAIFVTACQPAGSATNAPGTTQDGGTTPAAASPSPAHADPPFSFQMPSFTVDLELEALLPNEIGGEAVDKGSMSGGDLIGDGTGTENIQAILTQFRKTPADMSVAFGDAAGVNFLVYRVRGIDANALFQAFLTIVNTEGTTVSDATVGGKSVKKLVTINGETSYIYASGDVLFTVEADADTAPALLDEAFSKLR